MKPLLDWMQNPKQRRQLLSLASGALILASLAAGSWLELPRVRDGMMLAAALVAGSDIALRALRSLQNRHVSIELLVTIATLGALAIGEYWEAAAVTFLFIFGAYLEARTLSRTRQVLGQLLDLAPVTAIVLRDGRSLEMPAHEVQSGEIVLVKPGAKIAVDGEVIEGSSAVDESAITGEPMPEDKQAGSLVFAGTVNQNGLLKIHTTGAGADTALARIIRRVEEAQEEKAPTQRFIERFARWYTPSIIGFSVLVFLITQDIELSLTLLVIGCPGALVISTPVSIVAGVGRAAQQGILMKGGEYLENSGKISALALDKTGTLTQGKPAVKQVIALGQLQPAPEHLAVIEGIPDGTARSSWQDRFPQEYFTYLDLQAGPRWTAEQAQVLGWAAIAEAGSEHPLARAILAEGERLFAGGVPEAGQFTSHTGQGIQAWSLGHTISAGSSDFLKGQGLQAGSEVDIHLNGIRSRGETAVLVALDQQVIGLLAIADPLRASAPEMIKRLKDIGLKRIVMLTGDDPVTARTIAAEAGITEVYAGLLPDDKLQIVRRLQQEGQVVAMIGDGINDAPALAAADIGVAMGMAGTGIAIETADLALMSDDLLKVPQAIRLSRATLSNIRLNVIIALATVSILLLGVLLGKVHMAGGMLVHEASVLIVILNGMRLLRG
jgi:Cd2+/Zn2+-exporting ATPase